MGFLEAGMRWNKDFSAANSGTPCRDAPANTDLCDVVQWLGGRLVWTTKALCFLLLYQSGYFPTSSGTKLISVRADTWLMCVIMQGGTSHLQWKQTPGHSSWALCKGTQSPPSSLTHSSKKTGRKKKEKEKVSVVSVLYLIRKKKKWKEASKIIFFFYNCNLFYNITYKMPMSSNYR